MRQILRTLLADLIDYAALFPPAALSMSAAVEEYNRQRVGVDAFALGRLICPASRLDELTEHGRILMPGTFATSGYREMAQAGMEEPWPVSVVIDTELGEAVRAIDAFNDRHGAEDGGLAKVTTVELRVERSGDIDAAVEGIPKQLIPFFEIPLDGDPRGMIAALAGQDGLHAKIRCGGVTPDAIPGVEAVAGFITGCSAAGVPFKATAGLHHPIRGEQPLTYAPDAPRAIMHGFVNVFLAAAVVRARLGGIAEIEGILSETDAGAFALDGDTIGWRDVTIDAATLADVRQRFAVGYGSCSFREPLDDLRALGWA